MAPEVVLSPLFGILFSSVIVGNTRGELAEIDFRQGEWTMGCLRRGEGKEKVRSLLRESLSPVSVTFTLWVRVLISPKTSNLGLLIGVLCLCFFAYKIEISLVTPVSRLF